jgi:hypothetical protein
MIAQKHEFPATTLLQTESKAFGSTSRVTTALICESPLLLSGLEQTLSGTPFVVPKEGAATRPRPVSDQRQEPALLIFAANQFSPDCPS